MQLSRYIKELESLLKEHGDVEVQKYNTCFDRVDASTPVIAYKRVLKVRESKPAFTESGSPVAGEKVVRV